MIRSSRFTVIPPITSVRYHAPKTAAALTAYTLTVNASASVMLYALDPMNVYSAFFWVGSGASRGLLTFDLTALPAAAVIDSTTLSLYLTLNNGGTTESFNVYRNLKAAVLAQATWNSWKTGSAWTTAGGFDAADCEQTPIGSLSMAASPTVNQYYDWALTAATKADLSGYVLMIKRATETGQKRFACATDAAGTRPKLVINYRA